jgi:molybdopterin molybdotransferase
MELRPFGRLIPATVARRRLLQAVRPVQRVEPVPVESAFGRVAAATVRAPRPVPAFARAAWDGYAVRSEDTRGARPDRPVALLVVGEVYAEQRFARRLRAGETVAIATGGALPRGADGVINFEQTEREGDRVQVQQPVRPLDRISPPGDDFRRGATLVRRGEELSTVALGMLAACGFASVRVFARPVVEVVPNGNELVPPGKRVGPGKIFESNNATLAAVISASGGIPRLSSPIPDDERAIESRLRSALRTADLVLATGGSSVGERDYLPRIFPRIGKLLFHGIAVRPGKPTLAAAAGGKLVIGLPGHPTSCLANMYWLVLPVLRRLAHREGPGWTEAWVTLGSDALAPSPGLATVVPLRFRRGRAFATFHGSSAVTSLKGATAFTLLSPGRRILRSGSRIRVSALDPPLGSIVRPGNRVND